MTYSVVLTTGSSYAWSVPAGAVITAGATGPGNNQITVTFGSSNGDISVTETNAASCTGSTKILTIQLAGCGLSADFTGTPLTICVGSAVTFTNTSTGTTENTTYSWNFGTGASPSTANTVGPHVVSYTTAGLKTVSLTVTDGASSTKTKTDYITVTPTVTINAFSPATSTRCQGAATVTRTTTATNSTGITYSLDALSLTGGNTINAATGAVTYASTWSGTTTITASAAGCNGPASTTHVATVTPTVTINPFSPATSTRCQGAATVTTTTTANNSTGITYSLNGASITGGNTINPTTGAVTYVATWTGTTIITATAAGCNGPATTMLIVNVTPTVTINAFSPATSSRCQGAGTVTKTTTATNSTGITYSLDALSLAGGNTINAATGAVTYSASWSGTTIVTASAAGCNGPATTTFTVTVNPLVTPAFDQLGPYCVGTTPGTLPGTSTNGITGTWVPATISTATAGSVVYTFTPNTGLCVTTATMTVVVNPLPGAAGTITGPATVTQGQTGVVFSVASIANATGYNWSLPTGASITNGDNTNSITVSFSASAVSGIIRVTGTNTCGNGTVSADFSVTVSSGVPLNLAVDGDITGTQCYNASEIITVAETATFTVEATGHVEMIAGVAIRYKPGTKVVSGGYMYGHIAPGGPWCLPVATLPIGAIATGEDELPMASQKSSFRLYPNPTSGKFTLEQTGGPLNGIVKVAIIGMHGEKVLTRELSGEKKYEFSIGEFPVGLYFVKVIAGEDAETLKLVKTN